jgi:predicted transcriptional regulator
MDLMVAITPGTMAVPLGVSQAFSAQVLCGSMGGMENVTRNASIEWSLSANLGTIAPLSGSTTLFTGETLGNTTLLASVIYEGLSGEGDADVHVGGSTTGNVSGCAMLMAGLDPSSSVVILGENQTFRVSAFCGTMTGGMQNVTSNANITWSVGSSGGTLNSSQSTQVTFAPTQYGNATLWAVIHYQGETTECSAFLSILESNGSSIPRYQVRGIVTNGSGQEIRAALVQVLNPMSGDVVAGGSAGAQGEYLFDLPGETEYELRATSPSGLEFTTPPFFLSHNTTVELSITRPATSGSPELPVGLPPWALPSLIALMLAILLVALFFASDITQLAILLPPLLLYSRVKRDNVLEHFQRGRLYGYIEAHPGVSYSDIRKGLELANGMASYHLLTLEREQYILSRREGASRRYYASRVAPSEEGSILSWIQDSILSLVRQRPGIHQSEIARALGTRRQNVNYNVQRMERAGLLRLEGWGLKKRCFVTGHTVPGLDTRSAP